MEFSFNARLTLFLKDTVILKIFLVRKKENCNLNFFYIDIVIITFINLRWTFQKIKA